MKIIRRVAVVAFAAALSGCAAEWVKPDATKQDLLADRSNCEREAETEYSGAGGGLRGLGASIDKRGFFERCMTAHGWRAKSSQTASVQASPSTRTDPPLTFGYSR
jgi:hypothetical protein